MQLNIDSLKHIEIMYNYVTHFFQISDHKYKGYVVRLV